MSSVSSEKKLLENPLIGSMVVPLAIIIIGSLIIFGVTKMISVDRSYKDLVNEMHSKTFGNRWIAAYELSKKISTSSIKEEDVPWLVENLSSIYKKSVDPRTRDFIIVALSALKTSKVLPTIELGLGDKDKNVVFHSIAALGNMPKVEKIYLEKLMPFLSNKDIALQHAAVFSLATHKYPEAEKNIAGLLGSNERSIRHAAATALVYYQNPLAIPVLEEILNSKVVEKLNSHPSNHEAAMRVASSNVYGLKLNVIRAIGKSRWLALETQLEKFIKNEKDLSLVGKARETLNLLKN